MKKIKLIPLLTYNTDIFIELNFMNNILNNININKEYLYKLFIRYNISNDNNYSITLLKTLINEYFL